MKHLQIALPMASTMLLGAASLLHAQDTAWQDRNQVQLGYRMGWSMSLKLRNVGSLPAANNPSINGKSYGDGFVGKDDTGNAGNLTTYWGYQNPSQVVDGNSYLVMHNSNSGQIGSSSNGDTYNGLELTWQHQLDTLEPFRYGIESAFSWMSYSVKQTVTAPSSVLGADAYSLGYTPPSAPYTGTPNSGPFIPVLGTQTTGLPVTLASDFDANLYGVRLGPYLDAPFTKHFMMSLSAGLSVVLVKSSFSYTESYSTPGGTGISTSASASDFSAVVGGYINLQACVKVTDQVYLFTGMQYQPTQNYKVTAGNKQAELDFGNPLYWTLGIGYSF